MLRKRSVWPGVMAAMVIGTPALSAPAKAPEPDTRVMAAVQGCEQHARGLLERVVAIDSGTGDKQGLDAVGAVYAEELRALGANVRTVAPVAPAVGDNVVATLTGTGRGRILLIAHMDTVFSPGSVAARKPHWEGRRYVGPGAGDDKSGGVTAICALQSLKTIGFRDFARIDVLLNSNEETGSIGTRDLIHSMARESDIAINLERGVPTDKVIASRKGSGVLTLQLVGRGAHSGLEPEKGRNAALEAARMALELGKLSDPRKQTTVVVTILAGGDKINVVPDHALIRADVRAYSAAEFDRVEKAASALAASPAIAGVTASSALQRNFPPWPRVAGTDVLIARANRLYAELGRTLTPIDVGSSADVSYAAETGTPALDAFGIEGDGAHGPDDYADFATFAPRTYLLTRMLMDSGRDPPRR